MVEYKIGVVGLPGNWSTEVLANAVEARTGFRLVVDMKSVSLDLSTKALTYGNHNLCELDALIIKKISREYSFNALDRLELLRIAEAQGVRVYSRPDRILRLVDRLSCTVSLSNAGIQMPETVVTEDLDMAHETVREFGESIFKPLYSTKARGMRVISASQGGKKIRQTIKEFHDQNPMMYIQKRKDLRGRDFGMVFLGGDYLGSYARVCKNNSWNTTIHHGGKYTAYKAGADLIEFGSRAQAPFGLDFTTVDVAITENGPVVFEVSAFGGFRGAQKGIGIDAAGLYADYVINNLVSVSD